jgi:hypothetical protein
MRVTAVDTSRIFVTNPVYSAICTTIYKDQVTLDQLLLCTMTLGYETREDAIDWTEA